MECASPVSILTELFSAELVRKIVWILWISRSVVPFWFSVTAYLQQRIVLLEFKYLHLRYNVFNLFHFLESVFNALILKLVL